MRTWCGLDIEFMLQPSLKPTPEEMHNCYLAVTGTDPRTCPLTLIRIRDWDNYLFHGYGEQQLKLVILFQMKHRRARNWSIGVWNFERLIRDMESFQGWLAQAQHEQREAAAKRMTPRERILNEFRRAPAAQAQVQVEAKHAGAVSRELLNKWRREAGLPERVE